jgi:hypothetical protein
MPRLPVELWKELKDPYLFVSNRGRVRIPDRLCEYTNHKGKHVCRIIPGFYVSPHKAPNGYMTIHFNEGGDIKNRKKYSLHRLIARCFVNGYSEELTVNHINGIKTDNRIENLEWVTLSENSRLEWKTGLLDMRGDKFPTCKLRPDDVLNIRQELSSGCRQVDIARKYQVAPSVIHAIKTGKTWKHLT